MGKKSDAAMRELVPTRSLLRWLADQVGLTIEVPIDTPELQAVTELQLRAALHRMKDGEPAQVDRHRYPGKAPEPTFEEVIDREIELAARRGTEAAAGAALAPWTGEDRADDSDMIRRIAEVVGVNTADVDQDGLPLAILTALQRITGAGGDVEVPKGDSLTQAVTFGHRQNNDLRDRLAKADLLLQRIAGSLQVTHDPAGDGEELLQAVQRTETAKVMLRRRIQELRRASAASFQSIRDSAADELEVHLQRLFSAAEQAEWTARHGRAAKG